MVILADLLLLGDFKDDIIFMLWIQIIFNNVCNLPLFTPPSRSLKYLSGDYLPYLRVTTVVGRIMPVYGAKRACTTHIRIEKSAPVMYTSNGGPRPPGVSVALAEADG